MRVWYFDIPEGTYTTRQIMELAEPNQKMQTVLSTFRRLDVQSVKLDKQDVIYNKRNTKLWLWRGAEYYLKMRDKK